MASPIELARSVAGFDLEAVAHLQRLVRTWGLLADLSLGDVLVLAPVAGDAAGRFVVLANVRASTAATPRSSRIRGLMSISCSQGSSQAMVDTRSSTSRSASMSALGICRNSSSIRDTRVRETRLQAN